MFKKYYLSTEEIKDVYYDMSYDVREREMDRNYDWSEEDSFEYWFNKKDIDEMLEELGEAY